MNSKFDINLLLKENRADLNFATTMCWSAFGEELCKAQSLSPKMIIDTCVLLFDKSYMCYKYFFLD